MLLTFSVVNLLLWCIKQHTPEAEGILCVPALLPLLGFLVCIGFVLLEFSRLVR